MIRVRTVQLSVAERRRAAAAASACSDSVARSREASCLPGFPPVRRVFWAAPSLQTARNVSPIRETVKGGKCALVQLSATNSWRTRRRGSERESEPRLEAARVLLKQPDRLSKLVVSKEKSNSVGLSQLQELEEKLQSNTWLISKTPD